MSIRTFADILVPFVQATTLSGGSFTILLDQHPSGVTVTVACGRHGCVGVREAFAYCEAIEYLMKDEWVSLCLSAILVAQFETLPTTFAAMRFARSRHAMLILWNNGVWITSKTTQAQKANEAILGTQRSYVSDSVEMVPMTPHDAQGQHP